MRAYDFSPLGRSLIGFDRMANLIDAASKLETAPSYPPYNIEQLGEDSFRIELAVAGFTREELSLESHQNVLTVTGTKANEDAPRSFVHRGIARRGFERRFQLADHVIVQEADVADGLLTISLKRELPEALKPRSIAIGTSGKTSAAANDKKLTPKTRSGKVKAA